MRNETDKAEVELEVFKEFADLAGLPGKYKKGDAEKREPDICYENGGNTSYYELAELCSPDIAANITHALKTGQVTAAFVGDNPETILRQKLGKTYSVDGPINLILYTSGRIITPAEDLIETFNQIVKNTSENPYEKIFLLGEIIFNITGLDT